MPSIKHDTFFRRNSYLLLTAAWLLTFAFIINNYLGGNPTPESTRKSLQNKIRENEREINGFFKDTILLNSIISKKYTKDELLQLKQKDFFTFAYLKDNNNFLKLIFWDTQQADPNLEIAPEQNGTRLVKLSNGWFIRAQKDFLKERNHYLIICLIPVKWSYYIQNKYLRNHFPGLKKSADNFEVTLHKTSLPVFGRSGNLLFYLQEGGNQPPQNINLSALIPGIAGLLLILFFVNILGGHVAESRGVIKGTAVLAGTLLFLHLALFAINPFHFRQLFLFSPPASGKNFLVGSLGGLFINSILFVWIILFIRYHIKSNYTIPEKLKTGWRYLLAGGIALAMTFITFTAGDLILKLVTDLSVSFDVLHFFSLNIYSFIGFIVLGCLATGYFFLIQILMQPLSALFQGKKFIPLILIAAAGLLQLSFTGGGHINYKICQLLWLLLFVFLLEFKMLLLHAYRLASSGFIFWIFFFSVSITSVIVIQNRNKELEAREKFAENLADKADPTGPVIMSIILNDFKNVYLSKNFYKFRDSKENLSLKDSLIRETFSGYLNKYNTEIYTYDAAGHELFNLRPVTYNELNTIIQTQGKPTGIPDLYSYDVSYSNFNYISKKTITDTSGKTEGYVFILSRPKKFKSETLYPELFSRGNTLSLESSSEYAFAIYDNGRLTSSYNDYPFSTIAESRNFKHNGFKIIQKNGYEELWYRPEPGKTIVITKPDKFILESITLFAYLFLSFLIITLIFNLFGRLISDRKDGISQRSFWQPTIRNQVQGTIILISIFSFIVIGISTILFFINKSEENNKEFLSRTIHIVDNELHGTSDSSLSFLLTDNSIRSLSEEKLESIIDNLSNIHATDINLYDPEGNLRASSLPLPYDKGIVSRKMDPVAWYHLHIMEESQFFTQQKIGTLQYLSNYLVIKANNGNTLGYLNIPFFESQKKVQDEISNFLVAIINLNAFIFLIAGIIALFITSKITRSFSLISDKMKRINLQTGNEEIIWNRKDEIGDLVKEYNKMVKQLEISADKLARSEREGAWREMARQVAHEIKNPLTPMKLNLQYLQRSIDKNQRNIKEITQYVAGILLEQIDHLSQIASDFSQFANINNTKLQTFDINEILRDLNALYATNDRVKIEANLKEELWIYADKTQINRLFTNLLQNAVQSIPEFRKIKIILESYCKDNYVTVTVKDNGIGIPPSLRDKIFTPNFTTKSSGTGLGLAMCKGIVEKANGKIWFETEEGNWTIFYVQIPMANRKSEPGADDENR